MKGHNWRQTKNLCGLTIEAHLYMPTEAVKRTDNTGLPLIPQDTIELRKQRIARTCRKDCTRDENTCKKYNSQETQATI
jgi:hypothetical protein